jgi:hypothetical protein
MTRLDDKGEVTDDFLFSREGKLSNHLVGLERLADQMVDEISEDEILSQSTGATALTLLNQLMPRTPNLLTGRAVVRRLPLPGGSLMEFRMPFGGTGALFAYTPTQRAGTPPRGEVAGVLILTIPMAEKDADAIEAEFRDTIHQIQKWLQFIRDDLTPFEGALSERLKSRVEIRQARVRSERASADDLLRRFGRES